MEHSIEDDLTLFGTFDVIKQTQEIINILLLYYIPVLVMHTAICANIIITN